MMNKKFPLFVAVAVMATIAVVSCSKEYSLENGKGDDELIIGADCRISKIAVIDTPTNIGLGSIAASINDLDEVTDITSFDSLSATVITNAQPIYKGDSIYVNPDEYFVTDPLNNKRVIKFHRLLDHFDPTSAQIDVDYIYDSLGHLIQKTYRSSSFSVNPLYSVGYIYVGNNLDSMAVTDLSIPEVISTAKMTYLSNFAPRNFMYIFPDEKEPEYAQYNQFFNFGTKSVNGTKTLKIRNYIGGSVTSDSTNAVFGSYTTSRDNYVLSVILSGGSLPCIPAQKGKLRFSYKCK